MYVFVVMLKHLKATRGRHQRQLVSDTMTKAVLVQEQAKAPAAHQAKGMSATPPPVVRPSAVSAAAEPGSV